MRRSHKSKAHHFLIGTIFVAAFLMLGIGYAILSQQLDIRGTAQITSNWKILFTSAEEKEMMNATTTRKEITNLTTLNLGVELQQPGASATYDVVVENQGDLDAVLSSINGVDEGNNQDPKSIKVSVENIRVGDSLLAGDKKTFQVKVYWDPNVDFSDTNMQKEIEITLTYEQNDSIKPVFPTTDETCFKTDGAHTITGYLCSDTVSDVVIPSTIDGNTITTIGKAAFQKMNLTSVVIPESITTIGAYAFYDNVLTSVTIPDSVTILDMGVFEKNQLTSVILPSHLTAIYDEAFSRNKLTSVEIPASVESIGSMAFQENQINTLILHDGLLEIQDLAFNNNLLTTLVIPDSVTTIGGDAFSYNQLTIVTIGRNVTDIGSNAFWKYSDTNPNLTTIINKTGRPFRWGDITGGSYVDEMVTGTTSNGIQIIA